MWSSRSLGDELQAGLMLGRESFRMSAMCVGLVWLCVLLHQRRWGGLCLYCRKESMLNCEVQGDSSAALKMRSFDFLHV